MATSALASRRLLSSSSKAGKSPFERLKEFLIFNPESPSYASFPGKSDEKGYRSSKTAFRHPSPGSQPPANIPSVSDPELVYNTQYYTRDTRRTPMAEVTSVEGKQFPLLELPEVGSPGRKNPVVARYDPSMTRSAMTTTWKGMKDELKKRQANHLPRPWWHAEASMMQERRETAEKNQLPLPVGIARKSMGIPRYTNTW